jgi:RNA polymerase sigma factor (sigma-70 family)
VSDDEFLDLIRRVRSGDEDASRELVERYGAQIRRVIRVRLTDSGLRRVMDSQDICQSVMANFFLRATAGQFDLESPEQLFGLLATMARNKLTNKVQYHRAGRRDLRRSRGGEGAIGHAADRGATPSVYLAKAEILERFRSLLTDEERQLLDLRAEGRSWSEIATQRGDNPDRIRKQLSRTIERIAAALEDGGDGNE